MSQHKHPIVEDRIIEGEGTSRQAWQSWQGLHTLDGLNVKNQFPRQQRVCIFAPHPDDEILGCGGLLQQLVSNGNDILIIYVTNGTQSHPQSQIYPPKKLNIIRPQESRNALQTLGIIDAVATLSFEITDGNVAAEQALLQKNLADTIRPSDILVTPFVHDGHPDHEITGQVIAVYAQTHQLPCYQVLIWAWHWATPADERIPWHLAMRLDLTDEQQSRKLQASQCFVSQTTIDTSTGNAPILSTKTIDRLCQPYEVYLLTSCAKSSSTLVSEDSYSESYFDSLYRDNTDPWQYQTRWYEQRKRDMSLAVLPQAQYDNAIELGCGNGVFSALLASRCQTLLSIDGNQKAVDLARQRLVGLSHVKVIQGVIPKVLFTLNTSAPIHMSPLDNATQPLFDLIVISEILYYLSSSEVDVVIAWIKQNLAKGGTLLCCHWRYAIDGFELTGERVHTQLQQAFSQQGSHARTFHLQSQIIDSDFLLDAWQVDAVTVAMQENLV